MGNAELDELTFEILRAAVRVARDEQIRSLPALRARLARMYPQFPEQIKGAIETWAQYVKQANPNGVSRNNCYD
jgi:hypothetical protein